MKKIILFVAALFVAQSAAAQTCDRECLRGMVTQYLDALLAHDPGALPLAPQVRFTEDNQELQPGEGLWQNIESLGVFRQDVLDVRNGTAGVHVVAQEAGMPVLVAIRLKVVGNQISEVESTVVRSREEGMIFNPAAIAEASAAMNLTPAPEQRNTRAEMERLALLYPEGLRVGSFVTADAQFAPEAYRFENGQLMRGEGELSVWEMFKIYDGRIQAVEAFMEEVPAGTPFGWD